MNINGAGFDVNLFYTLKSSSETGSVSDNAKRAGSVLPAQERRKTDRVEISARSGEEPGTFLTELKKKLVGSMNDQPDADRVQRLHDEISAGSYDIDAGELARQMLL